MTKDIVEPKEVELSDKQQYIQLQLTDLNNKEKNLMFQLDQVKASQQVFNQAFIEASQEVAEEVLKEEENSMDILIPLVVISAILLVSIKKFKPQVWKKIVAKFKK
jgi:hypothetical protein